MWHRQVRSIDPSQLPSDTGHVLDVREGIEWVAGHIEGAQHIPLHELPERIGELPSDEPVLVVCKVGGRSAQATAFLSQRGYDAVNLDGGLVAWEDAGRPLVSETGAHPGVA